MRRAGVGGAGRLGGRGAEWGDRKGSASWFEPRGANPALLRAAGRSCLSAAPSSRPRLSLLLPPSSEPGGAGSRSGGGGRAEQPGQRACGQRGRRASVPLFTLPGLLSPRPRRAGPSERRTERKTAPQVHRPGGGRQRGHVLPGQEKHSAHHGRPGPSPSALCGGGGGESPPGSGSVGGTAGASPEASCVAAGGAGPVSALQPPPPSLWGQCGGGGRAPLGWAGLEPRVPLPSGLQPPPRRGMCQRMAWTGRMRS